MPIENNSPDVNDPVSGLGRRCAFVGDELLVAQCADIAREAGLEVVVIASEHPQVREYAEQHSIPHVRSAQGLDESLSVHAYDVLLSVANLRVLSDAIVDRAEVAINFHDGPLPGYSGLNVTTWALLAGESEHAITWHVITSDVDGGHVIAVERFAIQPDDTAFSLNARCYEAALGSFPAIVQSIVDNTLSPEPQPDDERRVFRRYERPIVVFDPTQDASTFARATRSVALGHRMRNTMGASHLVVGTRQVIVDEVGVQPGSGSAAGTVVSVEPNLIIATVDGDVVISACSTGSGVPMSPAEAAAHLDLSVGQVCSGPESGLVARFAELDQSLARNEQTWRERLAGVEIVTPSVFDAYASDAAEVREATIELADGVAPHHVVAAVAAWHRRVARNTHSVFHVSNQFDRQRVDDLGALLEYPLAVFELGETTTFDDLVALADAELETTTTLGPFLRDLAGRDPELHGRAAVAPVRLELDNTDESAAPSSTDPTTVLVISMGQDSARLVLRSSQVDTAGLARIAAQIDAVLVGGLAAPETPISALRIMGPAETEALDAINATSMDYDRSATIDSLFDARVALAPDAPALSSGSHTLTYRELHDASTAFAQRLRDAGVASGDLVGIAVDRGIDMVVAVLATHQCGAAYVPLDPTYPADRLAFMISDSGLRTVVAEPGATILDDVTGVTVVHPLADGQTEAQAPTERVAATHSSDDLAYVIYTSGSTGTPKGVMLEHRNVVNFFVAMDDVIDHDPPGVWLALTSLSFDISVLELLWTFTRGFHVVLKADSGLKGAKTAVKAKRGPRRPVSMSMFYFAAGEDQAGDGYRLLLDSARFADRHGFEAVWTPERHFHAFGGVVPQPERHRRRARGNHRPRAHPGRQRGGATALSGANRRGVGCRRQHLRRPRGHLVRCRMAAE